MADLGPFVLDGDLGLDGQGEWGRITPLQGDFIRHDCLHGRATTIRYAPPVWSTS
jgi:hypothetical protein